jgi:hypothetical protein
MKFSALVKGQADVRPVELMLPGHENPIVIGQRPISAWEEKDAIDKALAMFDPKGLSKPAPDDPRYVMCIWACTLVLSCQAYEDHSFTANDGTIITYKKGEQFFADANEILQELDRDRVSYLYEMQQRIQEDHGMRKERLSPEEMMAATHQIVTSEVGADDLPFWKWGPSARASYMHFLASALFQSALDKSPYGSTSSSDITSATKSPE